MTVMCAIHHIPIDNCGCNGQEQYERAQAAGRAREVEQVSQLKPYSAYWQEAYYKSLMKCCERYGQMMIGPSDDLSAFNNVVFADAIRDRLPLPKLCRWLGYIQGCLIERCVTTVEAERDWTRPLFRPLDFG